MGAVTSSTENLNERLAAVTLQTRTENDQKMADTCDKNATTEHGDIGTRHVEHVANRNEALPAVTLHMRTKNGKKMADTGDTQKYNLRTGTTEYPLWPLRTVAGSWWRSPWHTSPVAHRRRWPHPRLINQMRHWLPVLLRPHPTLRAQLRLLPASEVLGEGKEFP